MKTQDLHKIADMVSENPKMVKSISAQMASYFSGVPSKETREFMEKNNGALYGNAEHPRGLVTRVCNIEDMLERIEKKVNKVDRLNWKVNTGYVVIGVLGAGTTLAIGLAIYAVTGINISNFK